MQGPLPFPTVIIVAVLAGPGFLHCWEWVPDFLQGLCHCEVVVEIAVVSYELLLLDCYHWMEQLQLMGVSMGVVMVVYAVVLPAILQN